MHDTVELGSCMIRTEGKESEPLMSEMDLKGRIVIITGAGGGMGSAMTLGLAARGSGIG
jgi:FlaA1/EpsC-like NDP-sugar epimerase